MKHGEMKSVCDRLMTNTHTCDVNRAWSVEKRKRKEEEEGPPTSRLVEVLHQVFPLSLERHLGTRSLPGFVLQVVGIILGDVLHPVLSELDAAGVAVIVTDLSPVKKPHSHELWHAGNSAGGSVEVPQRVNH